eukprot:7294586-Lingulodinium_polyedra.AAC.1
MRRQLARRIWSGGCPTRHRRLLQPDLELWSDGCLPRRSRRLSQPTPGTTAAATGLARCLR